MTQHLNFFENTTEVRRRLKSTYVKYDNSLYFVVACFDGFEDGVIRLVLCPSDLLRELRAEIALINDIEGCSPAKLQTTMRSLPSKMLTQKMCNSPKFNKFRPFPLGFVNSKQHGLFFACRTPSRGTCQGLTPEAVKLYFGGNLSSEASTVSLLQTQEFQDCVSGNYPDFFSAINTASIKKIGCAFSRDFAVASHEKRGLVILHKTKEIGLFSQQQNSCYLYSPSKWHKEALEEALNSVCSTRIIV